MTIRFRPYFFVAQPDSKQERTYTDNYFSTLIEAVIFLHANGSFNGVDATDTLNGNVYFDVDKKPKQGMWTVTDSAYLAAFASLEKTYSDYDAQIRERESRIEIADALVRLAESIRSGTGPIKDALNVSFDFDETGKYEYVVHVFAGKEPEPIWKLLSSE